MKSTQFGIRLILLTVLLFGLSRFAGAACSKTILVAYDDWIPYTYTQTDGTVVGLDAEIIAEMMKRAGCDYQFRQVSSKRAFIELKNGAVDMLRGASVTEERKLLGWFTEAYRQEEIRLMIRKGEAQEYPLDRLKSIIGTDILISAGQGWYGPEYAELVKDERFQQQLLITHSNVQRVKMLERRRIHMMLGDPISMIHSARSCCKISRFAIHPLSLYSGEVHFLLGFESLQPSDKAAIDSALKSMKQDGSLRAIIDRYSLN
ncbi:substrate-binding periplasmic protein [Motiliproteus coralliicola]|uniref:substrate-binding periplasmic protein n=1 Tax=Motiliproteus coralliicola TaxID=2283196 RepID=UPI0014029312|nr:transporter substrate-binding domain-containing protein [Motiliproteus coralliicola]